jgi:hypothetical protein
MQKRSLRSMTLMLALCPVLLGGCSEPPPSAGAKESAKSPAAKPAEESVVKPSFGEVSFTLPKGWISFDQPQSASRQKDVQSLSFIRKIDRSLWANPGPVGTSNLPMLNIMITRRSSEAGRDDLEPKRLGNSLVKQRVFTKIVEASETKVANLTASKLVADSPQQGRVVLVLLPHNGYLYKWSLFGTKADDAESAAAMEALLESAKFN